LELLELCRFPRHHRARHRGRVCRHQFGHRRAHSGALPGSHRFIVNGSFWLGAPAGSGASLLFLDPNLVAPNVGWRLAFAIGGILGLGILLLPKTCRKARVGS
jgi:MFS family permease